MSVRSVGFVLRHPGVDRMSVAVGSLWSVGTAVALAATQRSLETSSFDGLNNLLQMPFALPWIFIPIGGIWSHETDAWVAAGMGWLNAALLLFYLPPWRRRRLPAPPVT